MKGPLWILLVVLSGSASSVLAQASQQAVAEVESTPFTYRAQGKRDPFRSPAGTIASEGETVSQKPAKIRIKELLESFQLDSLKLVAILFDANGKEGTQQSSRPVAMVEDPDGIGHLVYVGSYIGVNEGRITQIRDGEVLIEEPSPQLLDPTAVRSVTLQLHTVEETGQKNASTYIQH